MSFFSLSPDGKYLYYLNDEAGNDAGHLVRRSEDGKVEDITPDLPLYASFHVFFSQAGNALGFTQAGRDGFLTYSINVDNDGNIDVCSLSKLIERR